VERIRQTAGRDKRLRFPTLWRHVYDTENLRRAYFGLKRDAAPGVGAETWRHYGKKLEENLKDLSGRLRRGAYRAKLVKRAFIAKPDGRQRPLGVTALEDKIAQRSTVEVMNAICEKKWLNAGVLEDGSVTYSEEGVLQGGSISPLLADVYLHYVFDLWVEQWRRRQARGDVIVVRFADDFGQSSGS
jgi:retron-type reverse transcriptase